MIKHYSEHRVHHIVKSVSNSYHYASQEQLIMDDNPVSHVAAHR